MTIAIETATTESARVAAQAVREEVFNREWGLRPQDVSNCKSETTLTLVARCLGNQEIVAAITVINTSGDDALHESVNLNLDQGRTVARYTQLAVLKPYRGLNLPLHLILSAHELFVLPRGIEHTWLLIDADRVKSSSLCSVLGYRASSAKLSTDYGCSRLLVRDETSAAAEVANHRARRYLDNFDTNCFQINSTAWIPKTELISQAAH